MVSFVSTVGRSLEGARLLRPREREQVRRRRSALEHERERRGVLASHRSGRQRAHARVLAPEPDRRDAARAVGPRWYELWPSWQSLVSVAQRAGGLLRPDVRRGRRRPGDASTSAARSSSTGTAAGAPSSSRPCRPDPYHAAWVKQLGTAMKPKRPLAPGVWQRPVHARSRGREHHERHGHRHRHRAGKSVDDRPDGRPLREVRAALRRGDRGDSSDGSDDSFPSVSRHPARRDHDEPRRGVVATRSAPAFLY